ncbi:MAG: Gfo/Idh/MocA family protein [Anaerolineales bacterium]
MRILICGLGSIGRRHLRNLVSLGEKDIVLHRSGNSSLPPEELKDYPAESNLAAALDRWAPAAALVTNPTALHQEVAVPAARHGCQLFIEKPISHRMEGVAELRAAVAASGRRPLVGFQYRYHPGLQLAKRLVDDGTLGTPLSAQAVYGDYLPNWHPWEDYRTSYAARSDLGGGVLLTLCHPFDTLRWILGEVEAVTARTKAVKELDLEVETLASAILEHTGGALASVNLDYHQRPMRHSLEIVGTNGTLRWDQADGALRWWTADQPGWQEQPAPPGYERNTMFMDEMQHFLQIVGDESGPACTLDDGIRALEISLAARRSAAEGGRVRL